MGRIRVLIADDYQLFRVGLQQVCKTIGDFDIVGEAVNGQEAVDLALQLQPDIVLMDILMPVLDGIQATAHITTKNSCTKVIILTMYCQNSYVFGAIKAGAHGYLLKDIEGTALVEAVQAVNAGKAIIDPCITIRVLDEFKRLSQSSKGATHVEQLTEGEMDVLRLVARGYENRIIAARLHIAESTVSNHLREVYQKLNVTNRTQATLEALRRGWASLEPDV